MQVTCHVSVPHRVLPLKPNNIPNISFHCSDNCSASSADVETMGYGLYLLVKGFALTVTDVKRVNRHFVVDGGDLRQSWDLRRGVV